LILKAWGQLEEALALHKKEEAICLELGSKDGLQASFGNQAVILTAWGRLEEALALNKKKEAICLELGNKDGLQRSYGNQALILQAWCRLEEALALIKKQEAICLELGQKRDLGYCYWQWVCLNAPAARPTRKRPGCPPPSNSSVNWACPASFTQSKRHSPPPGRRKAPLRVSDKPRAASQARNRNERRTQEADGEIGFKVT
jgi:tetratricopeptide (TPR) repeat protein